MDENQLKKLIIEIVEKGSILKNKHTDEINAPVNYACIFSQSDDEFNTLLETSKKIGNIIEETQTWPLFYIYQPIDTISGQLKLLKIRHPDMTKSELGYADFTIDNYQDFKKKYLSQELFKLIEREDFEMIELMDPKFDVRVYFPDLPLDKQLWIN